MVVAAGFRDAVTFASCAEVREMTAEVAAAKIEKLLMVVLGYY
jgi:hypothetical protein